MFTRLIIRSNSFTSKEEGDRAVALLLDHIEKLNNPYDIMHNTIEHCIEVVWENISSVNWARLKSDTHAMFNDVIKDILTDNGIENPENSPPFVTEFYNPRY